MKNKFKLLTLMCCAGTICGPWTAATADSGNNSNKTLTIQELNPDPIKEFTKWRNNWGQSQPVQGEPEAAVLATSSRDGYPLMRMIYIVAADQKGFVFVGKENSYKVKNIMENPHVELLFYWDDPERTVKIQGNVERLDERNSDGFFHMLPKQTQLALTLAPPPWESNNNPKSVLDKYSKLSKQYEDQPIPKPEDAAAFRIIPQTFEFINYDVQTDLNTRFVYTWKNNKWNIQQYILP